MRSLCLVAVVGLLATAACDSTVGGSTVGSTATSAVSSGSGSSGDGGSASTGAGASSADGGAGQGGGGGAGSTCEDVGPGELNDTFADATELSGVDDCDNPKSVAGTMDGPDDVDWYFFDQTADVFGICATDPTRTWSQDAGGTIRVCKYVACQTGDKPSFDCPDGTTESTSPGPQLLPGCCGTAPFEVGGVLGLDCPGTDDVVTVYLKIDQEDPPEDSCHQYNLAYDI